MSPTRLAIIAFWILIGVMLLWQFYSYDRGITQHAIDHPQQQHFFFYPPGTAPAAAPVVVHRDGADVEQVDTLVLENTPTPGSFTFNVTLKNLGNAKATGVQVWIRPYKAASNYDEDVSQTHVVVLNDDDPISKLGDWVNFPDLAPGESSTQGSVFVDRTDFKPGSNPKPEIIFQSEKGKPAATANGNGT